jgi:hypothetical protein
VLNTWSGGNATKAPLERHQSLIFTEKELGAGFTHLDISEGEAAIAEKFNYVGIAGEFHGQPPSQSRISVKKLMPRVSR